MWVDKVQSKTKKNFSVISFINHSLGGRGNISVENVRLEEIVAICIVKTFKTFVCLKCVYVP
jgi:hypothetical protein